MTPSDETGPSWDDEDLNVPARPEFVSNLSLEPLVPRPTRILVAYGLVIAAVLSFVAVTALAALRFDELRDAMIAAVPDSLQDDYSDEEIRRAARVLIAAVGGLGLLLTLLHWLSIHSLVRRRSGAARIVFGLTVLLYLPVALLAPAIRSGGRIDDLLSIAALGCLLCALVLIVGRPVSTWLRQPERHDPIPLVRDPEGEEPGPEEPDPNEPDPDADLSRPS